MQGQQVKKTSNKSCDNGDKFYLKRTKNNKKVTNCKKKKGRQNLSDGGRGDKSGDIFAKDLRVYAGAKLSL